MKRRVAALLICSLLMGGCAGIDAPKAEETVIEGDGIADSPLLPDAAAIESPDVFVIDISDTEDVVVTSYWDDSAVYNIAGDDARLLIEVFQGKEVCDQIPACDNDIKIEFDHCTLLIHTDCGSVVYMTGEQTGATELSDRELDVLLDILGKYDIGTEASYRRPDRDTAIIGAFRK